MSSQARALALVCAAVSFAAVLPGARAGVITQTDSLPSTTTDFNSASSKVAPLVIQKFDTQEGTRILDSVTLSFNAQISNKYGFMFAGPATLTESVASTNPAAPTPTVTLFQPDGKTPLITASEPNDPSVLTKSVTYAGHGTPTFSSDLPSTSPNYVAPTVVTASGSHTLNSAADLALFTQSSGSANTISLPVAATAFSTFHSNSGNGTGWVSTYGEAGLTVTYTWHPSSPAPETVPEPGAVALWGVGLVSLLAARRARRTPPAA